MYPNPVTGNTISLRFNKISSGSYTLQLLNAAGQLIEIKTLHHNASVAAETFEIPNGLAAGKYDLKLAGEGLKLNTTVIKK